MRFYIIYTHGSQYFRPQLPELHLSDFIVKEIKCPFRNFLRDQIYVSANWRFECIQQLPTFSILLFLISSIATSLLKCFLKDT